MEIVFLVSCDSYGPLSRRMSERASNLINQRADFIIGAVAALGLFARHLNAEGSIPFQHFLLASLWSPTIVFEFLRRLTPPTGNSANRSAKIFLSGFTLVFFSRQLFTGDALLPIGGLVQGGKAGGGPLGEPNFESVAIACIGGQSSLLLDRALRASELAPSIILKVARKTLVGSVCVWLSVWLTSETLIRSGLVVRDGYIISRAVFIFAFGNVERVWYVAPLAATYVSMVLLSVLRYKLSSSHRTNSVLQQRDSESSVIQISASRSKMGKSTPVTF